MQSHVLLVCLTIQSATPSSAPSSAPAAPQAPVNEAAAPLEGPQAGAAQPVLALTLEQAFELALSQNAEAAIAKLDSDAAFFTHRASFGAFDWTFSANGRYSDTDGEPQFTYGGEDSTVASYGLSFVRPLTTGGNFRAAFDSVRTQTNSAFSAINPATRDVVSMTYTQPLMRGAWSTWATQTQRQSELSWRTQLEKERATRQQLLLDVGNAYWDLVAAIDELEVKQGGVDLARKQVDQEQKRLDAGVGTRLDVLQAQTQVATREQERITAQTRVRTASDSLKRLIFTGRSEEIWNTDIAPRTELPKEAMRSDAPAWSDALSIAIEMRSDLRQQRLQIDLAALDHELRENEKGPQLDLELGANGEAFDGSASSALNDSLSYDNPTFIAALNYSIPLGNTSARNKLKSSWAALRAARLRYDSLETGVVREVREAVRQIAYQADAVAAARQSIELAREQLKAEEARRAVDITTTFQVLQFQQDLLAALSSERAARSSFAKAKLALERAQGTLGDR